MNRPDKKPTGKFAQKGFGESRSHGTRAAVLEEEVRSEREKYFGMPIDRKRKIYKCGDDNYVMLKDIVIWPEYECKKSQASVKKSSKTSTSDKNRSYRTPKFPVNEKLNRKISLFRGDITTLEIDAIVNAANNSLLGGGGVDGAIHSAAGSFLKKECSTLGGCDTGDAKITCGYKLPAKYVIHTVGPTGEKRDLLHSAYKRCLEVLKQNKLTSVAFPCISTGIFGYPIEAATHVALETIRQWLEKDPYSDKVERIILCVFLKRDVEVYEDFLPLYFPLSDDRHKGKKADAEEVPASDPPSEKSAEEKKDSTSTTAAAEPQTADERVVKGEEEGMEVDAKEAKNTGATTHHSSPAAKQKEEPAESEAKDDKEQVKEDGEKGKGSKRKSKGEVKDRKEEEESEKDGKRQTKL